MTTTPYRTILGPNQQIYQQLQLALGLNLRRQIFVAVCDDLILRDRLAAQLQAESNEKSADEKSPTSYPRLVSLQLRLDDPNPLIQIAQWLTQFPPPLIDGQRSPMPAFQILGVEHLTRQAPAIQRLFFTHLQSIERNLPLLDFSLLLWTTQPWYYAIPQSAPEFWRCRTGVFEFLGDPTPLSITSPERFSLQASSPTLPRPVASVPQAVPLTIEQASSQPHSSAQRTQSAELALDFDPELDLDLAEGLLEDSHPNDPIAAAVQELLTDQLPEQTPDQFLPPTQKTTPVPPPEPPADRPSTSSSASFFDLIAAVEEELENPWLVLADSLDQLYEPEVYESEEPPPSLDRPAPPASPAGAIETKSSRQHTPVAPAPGTPLTPVRTPSPVQATSGQVKAIKTVELDRKELDRKELDRGELDRGELDRSVATLPIQIPQELLAVSAQAMPLVQQIEQLHQQQAPPPVLAEAYRLLGNFYRDRVEQGDASPQNLSIALQAYEQMVLWLPESSPLWVDVLNDMGNLYWMLSRAMSSPAEALPYLQQGVRAYQLALDKLDPQTQAYTYPMVQNNLGAAYADLARYHDPIEHLELSIQAYQQALLYRSPDIDPLRYASTQNNLGTTYWNLAQYKDPVNNLKHSITAYSEALHYYNPAQEPLNYAMIQNNLGTAYWNLAQHERAQDWLLLAVAAYRKALQYRTIDSVPVAYAATQNNLGTAYWHIANNLEPSQERFEYLQQAIRAYEATLQAVDRLNMHQSNGSHLLNFDLFATHNNLGLAHYQTATDHSVHLDITTLSNHFQNALDHHITALQGWERKPNLRQTALNCILQTVRAAYSQLGLPGQSLALSRIPGQLLPEILPRL